MPLGQQEAEKKNSSVIGPPSELKKKAENEPSNIPEKVQLGKPIELSVPPPAKEAAEERKVIRKVSLLDNLHEEVISLAKTPIQTEPLTLEKGQHIWKEYSTKIASPDIKAIMDEAQLSVTDNQQYLVIAVGSTLLKGILDEEQALNQFFHKSIANDKVFMRIEVNASLKPKEVEAPRLNIALSEKEKYQKLLAENLHLETLRQKFDLRFDEN